MVATSSPNLSNEKVEKHQSEQTAFVNTEPKIYFCPGSQELLTG